MRHFQGQPFPLLYRGQMLLCYLPRAFWWITGISYFKHICFWNQENKETIWIHSWLSKLNIVEDHMIIKFWAHHDFTFSQPIGQHKQHIWICVDEILYALQRTKELKWLEHQFSYLWENVQKGFHKTFEIPERYSPTWMCIRFHIFKISSEARKGMEWNFARENRASAANIHTFPREESAPL